MDELSPANPSEMVIPKFDGEIDAYWWVFCTEKYFKHWHTPETYKMIVAGLAMKGPPFTWWLRWYPLHSSVNWDAFTSIFLWQFKPEWKVILPLPDDEEDLELEPQHLQQGNTGDKHSFSPVVGDLDSMADSNQQHNSHMDDYAREIRVSCAKILKLLQEEIDTTETSDALPTSDEIVATVEPIEEHSVTGEYVHVKNLTVTTIPLSIDFNGGTRDLLEADTKKNIETRCDLSKGHDRDATSLSPKIATPDCGFQKIIGKIAAAPESGEPPPPPKPPDQPCFVAQEYWLPNWIFLHMWNHDDDNPAVWSSLSSLISFSVMEWPTDQASCWPWVPWNIDHVQVLICFPYLFRGIALVLHCWVCQLKLYEQSGCLNSAHQMLVEMHNRGILSWTILIQGFLARGNSWDKEQGHAELSFLPILLGWWYFIPLKENGLIKVRVVFGCHQISLGWYVAENVLIQLKCHSLLLGFYVFGKNINFLKRWVETTIQSKLRMHGYKICNGWKQQELLSNLFSNMSKDCESTLVQLLKKFKEGHMSIEEIVFGLKVVGIELHIVVLGISKQKYHEAIFACWKSLTVLKSSKGEAHSTCLQWQVCRDRDMLKHFTRISITSVESILKCIQVVVYGYSVVLFKVWIGKHIHERWQKRSQEPHSQLGVVVDHNECEKATLVNIGLASKTIIIFIDLEDKIIFRGIGNDMINVVLVQCLLTNILYNEEIISNNKDVEVEKLGKTRHMRINRLWCCYNNDNNKFLYWHNNCYGSLMDSVNDKKNMLDWHFNCSPTIVTDSVVGLAYLHQSYILTIAHKHMRYNKFLSGVAKIIFESKVVVFMHVTMGSYGYVAPVRRRKRKKWDPGRHLATSTTVWSFKFKQWDPGKICVVSKFHNLEDKVDFEGVGNVMILEAQLSVKPKIEGNSESYTF